MKIGLTEFESLVRAGFEDSFHSRNMEVGYILNHINVLRSLRRKSPEPEQTEIAERQYKTAKELGYGR
jgi:hypothetical protein